MPIFQIRKKDAKIFHTKTEVAKNIKNLKKNKILEKTWIKKKGIIFTRPTEKTSKIKNIIKFTSINTQTILDELSVKPKNVITNIRIKQLFL